MSVLDPLFPFALGPTRHLGRIFSMLLLVLLTWPVFADARPPAPSFTVAPGPLPVAVRPGVAVVPGQPGPVWYVAGWYWTRHQGHWFRAPHRRSAWRPVGRTRVPSALVRWRPSDQRAVEQLIEHLRRSPRGPKPVVRPARPQRPRAARWQQELNDMAHLRLMSRRWLGLRSEPRSR